METLNNEAEQLKKIKKQEKNKLNYRKKQEEKKMASRKWYQENKEEKKEYYQENKEKKKEYYQENKEKKREYYQENKEKLKEYQRMYDAAHKDRKKEYNTLKGHYWKLRKVLNSRFHKDDIRHLRTHVGGWCGWNKTNHLHVNDWVEVDKECDICDEKMFKYMGKSRDYRRIYEPIELNALHCISCCNVMCNICGKDVPDYKYYKHFYLDRINSDLKEKLKLCPYITYLDDEKRKHFPCKICMNPEIQEEMKNYIERARDEVMRFGLGDKAISFVTNSGKYTFKCPYTDQDSYVISRNEAVTRLAKKVNEGKKKNDPDYLELCFEYNRGFSHHKSNFELICELKEHMELIENRAETHVIELTLTEAYTDEYDLSYIHKMIKTNIERLDQVSSIKQIVPAEKCLGFQYTKLLAFCDLKYITGPIEAHPEMKYYMDPDINSKMTKIREEKKTIYMVILTHEGSIEDLHEYFEELTIYPGWVENPKLLFTWSAKIILEEEDKAHQKALIQGHFIESKRHPGYFMNLSNFKICCSAISNQCSLPMKSYHTTPNESPLMLWEEMFLFHYQTLKNPHLSDNESSISSETESDESSKEESENYGSDESSNWLEDLSE